MNKYLSKLWEISQKKERFIIGLMSGTSLDGLDVALCRVKGTGSDTVIEVLQFVTEEYEPDLRERLVAIQSREQIDTRELTRLHSELGIWYGRIIKEKIEGWGMNIEAIDLIASHGQTVYHAPAVRKDELNATLQVVDGDHIAQESGIITMSAFCQKQTAAGGDGAPLAGIFDDVLSRHVTKKRMVLNVGVMESFH